MIKKTKDGKYILYTKDGSKKLGTHSSKKSAKKQEATIQSIKR